jgi:hypothetical protein
MSRRYAYILYFNVQRALYVVLHFKQESVILGISEGSVKGFCDEFPYQILRTSMPKNLNAVREDRFSAARK